MAVGQAGPLPRPSAQSIKENGLQWFQAVRTIKEPGIHRAFS